VLLGRGVVGLVRPELLPAGDAPPFARLNRTVCSPLCVALGALVARSAGRRSQARAGVELSADLAAPDALVG
jgi:hypothetical protein